MKKLLTAILTIGFATVCLLAQDAKIAGQWQLSLETPHGPMQGKLSFQQEGTKVTGTCDVEHLGSMALSGKVEGKKISISMDVPEAQMKLTMTGTVDGDKMNGTMDPTGGNWSATRQ
jgi:hypothetical protein